MGKNKLTTLLVACMMIMLCTATIVGGTYALWSDTVTTSNHLAAGKLEVTLTRTALKKHAVGANGLMTDSTDNTEASIADNTNFFGITEGELIAPTSTYEAKLKLVNSGDVAINYVINIVPDSEHTDSELASQLKVYIGTIDAQGNVTYNDGTALGTLELPGGSLNKGATTEFWVKVEFVNNNNTTNNRAQSKQASFDLIVNATQKVD